MYGCVDTDGDNWADSSDAFPNDPLEWFDEDGDNVGSNSDYDDRNFSFYSTTIIYKQSIINQMYAKAGEILDIKIIFLEISNQAKQTFPAHRG